MIAFDKLYRLVSRISIGGFVHLHTSEPAKGQQEEFAAARNETEQLNNHLENIDGGVRS